MTLKYWGGHSSITPFHSNYFVLGNVIMAILLRNCTLDGRLNSHPHPLLHCWEGVNREFQEWLWSNCSIFEHQPPYLCYVQRTQIWLDSAVYPMDTCGGKHISLNVSTIWTRKTKIIGRKKSFAALLNGPQLHSDLFTAEWSKTYFEQNLTQCCWIFDFFSLWKLKITYFFKE